MKNKHYYIWPAGIIGKTLYNRFSENGFRNIFLVDSYLEAEDIIHPDSIRNYQDSAIIISTLTHCQSIYNKAKEMGFMDVMMYYDAVDLLSFAPEEYPSNFWIKTFKGLKPHLLNNKQRYVDMLNSFEDDLSRECFFDNILFRLTKDVTYTFNCNQDYPQYFNSLIPHFNEESVIIDGGGYVGDTLKQFLSYSNGIFKSYYLFEPDVSLLEKARATSTDNRINYIGKGLGDKRYKFNFIKTGNSDGVIDSNGSDTVFLTTIDDEIKEKVSFIKLDIEGFELAALKGATKTIGLYAPTLAISVYHNHGDYVDILEYIRSIDPMYKFYLRKHSNFYADTVLYAVKQLNKI